MSIACRIALTVSNAADIRFLPIPSPRIRYTLHTQIAIPMINGAGHMPSTGPSSVGSTSLQEQAISQDYCPVQAAALPRGNRCNMPQQAIANITGAQRTGSNLAIVDFQPLRNKVLAQESRLSFTEHTSKMWDMP